MFTTQRRPRLSVLRGLLAPRSVESVRDFGKVQAAVRSQEWFAELRQAAEAYRPRRLYCVRCRRRRSGSDRRHFLASTLALGRVPPRLEATVTGAQSGFGRPAPGKWGTRCYIRRGRNVLTGSSHPEAPRAVGPSRERRAVSF